MIGTRFRQLVVSLVLVSLVCGSAFGVGAAQRDGLQAGRKMCQCQSTPKYPFSFTDLSTGCTRTCGERSCDSGNAGGSGGCGCADRSTPREEVPPTIVPESPTSEHLAKLALCAEVSFIVLPVDHGSDNYAEGLVYLRRVLRQSVFYDFHYLSHACADRAPPPALQ